MKIRLTELPTAWPTQSGKLTTTSEKATDCRWLASTRMRVI